MKKFIQSFLFSFFMGLSTLSGGGELNGIITDVDPIKVNEFTINDHICMAKNIYYEARNQEDVGQYAVAFVTMKRVSIEEYPDSVCEVVYEKNWVRKSRSYVAQFTWTLCENCNDPKDIKAWKKALAIAETVLKYYGTDKIVDITGGATHYHANYVYPKWRKAMDKIVSIDDHIFYIEDFSLRQKSS